MNAFVSKEKINFLNPISVQVRPFYDEQKAAVHSF
jgi:hypothetical protein